MGCYHTSVDDLFWDEAEGCFIRVMPRFAFFDPQSMRWTCRCERYARTGRCFHLARYRPEVTVWALEIYL